MSNYEISIVTPFHDIDIEIFKNGFESMKNQTLGFEKIEWIIVIHNSDDTYANAVYEMSAPYPNIVVERINNDKKTPSSPRNYGMNMATSRYIGFLDGDDSFLPDCLEKVLKEIKYEKAQIINFRREYELEKEDSIPVTEIVLWNQTYEKIVIDRNNWDDEKMFTGLVGMVTSRVYDLDFLRENDIHFDESVLFAEDFLFNLTAYGYAQKIVYLPQLIGYHYFINGASLVQSGNKSPETLIKYAEGYAKVFDMGLNNGFFMNSIISRLCVVLSRFLAANKDMTLEDRIKIKNILEPYILKTSHLRVSKVFSEKMVEDAYEIPRDVILNPEKWVGEEQQLLANIYGGKKYDEDPMLVELMKILDQNSQTDMGLRYGFSRIMTLRDFKKNVPLSDKYEYEKLVKLTTRIGESRIFTNDKLPYYSTKESAMGREFIYPHTESQVKQFGKMLDKLLEDKVTLLAFDSLPKVIRYNDNARMNTVWGIALTECVEQRRKDGKNQIKSTSPMEVLFSSQVQDSLQSRNLYALFNEDIEQIIAPNLWNVYIFFQSLKIAWGNSVIENKELFAGLAMKYPERKKQLDELWNEKFDEHTIMRIWPKLKYIWADCGGVNELYVNLMEDYVDKSLLCGSYLVDNLGILGIPNSSRIGTYELNREAGYFEFATVDGDADGQILDITEIEIGAKYELIVTNNAGFYRHYSGLIIEVLENADRRMIFKVAYRKEYNLTLRGNENVPYVITEEHMQNAVMELQNRFNVRVFDYSYGDVSILTGNLKSHLAVMLELSHFDSDKDGLKALDLTKASEFIADCLKESVKGYSAEKVDVEVKLCEAGSQVLYRDTIRYKNNLLQDQIIPTRLLDNPRKMKYFYEIASF